MTDPKPLAAPLSQHLDADMAFVRARYPRAFHYRTTRKDYAVMAEVMGRCLGEGGRVSVAWANARATIEAEVAAPLPERLCEHDVDGKQCEICHPSPLPEPTIEKYRDLTAAMYMFAGAVNAPLRFLDTLSAAANGDSFENNLLPFSPDEIPELCQPRKLGELGTNEGYPTVSPLPEPICEGDVMCEHKRCWDASRARVRENINKSRKEYLAARNLSPLPEIASEPTTDRLEFLRKEYPRSYPTPTTVYVERLKELLDSCDAFAAPVPLGEPAQTLPKRPERLKPMITGKRVQTIQYGIKAASEYTDGMEAYADALEAALATKAVPIGEGERFQRPRLHVNAATGESTYLADEANNLFDRMESALLQSQQRERELRENLQHYQDAFIGLRSQERPL